MSVGGGAPASRVARAAGAGAGLELDALEAGLERLELRPELLAPLLLPQHLALHPQLPKRLPAPPRPARPVRHARASVRVAGRANGGARRVGFEWGVGGVGR